jgi:aldehyde dehydrogenase (NAD+)
VDGSQLHNIIEAQRQFFATRVTMDVNYRLSQLRTCAEMLEVNEGAVCNALRADLGKSAGETFLGELAVLFSELKFIIKRLPCWMKPERAGTALFHLPGSSRICSEPLGVALIIGPWNYPFQLLLAPAIGALAAGNCAVLKPSELAPYTSRLIAKLIAKYFPRELITVVEGGVETSRSLLAEKFDHIFFTGGGAVGRIVALAAAETLTPVTLELGGKSPCIVHHDADLTVSARRIAWGKFFNAGQTCVAPDYLLVHAGIKDALLHGIKAQVKRFYTDNPKNCSEYGRIVNRAHFGRLHALLRDGEVFMGGDFDPDRLYIGPTILTNVSPESGVMGSEIFGPILPVMEYENLDDAMALVRSRPKPLALYFFSRDPAAVEHVLTRTTSGGAVINDVIVHVSSQTLPFGGVGESGMGRYHGKASFDVFSNKKAVMKRPFYLDLPLRYPPYGRKLGILKKVFRLIG